MLTNHTLVKARPSGSHLAKEPHSRGSRVSALSACTTDSNQAVPTLPTPNKAVFVKSPGFKPIFKQTSIREWLHKVPRIKGSAVRVPVCKTMPGVKATAGTKMTSALRVYPKKAPGTAETTANAPTGIRAPPRRVKARQAPSTGIRVKSPARKPAVFTPVKRGVQSSKAQSKPKARIGIQRQAKTTSDGANALVKQLKFAPVFGAIIMRFSLLKWYSLCTSKEAVV